MKTKTRENWHQCYLAKKSVYELLEKCDAEWAEKCQQAGCLKCGGRLDRSDYRRKPRGGPEEAKKVETWRDSFCCDVEGCRKRHTPPSVRFLGRKVYWGVVAVLMAAMQHGGQAGASGALAREAGDRPADVGAMADVVAGDVRGKRVLEGGARALHAGALPADTPLVVVRGISDYPFGSTAGFAAIPSALDHGLGACAAG